MTHKISSTITNYHIEIPAEEIEYNLSLLDASIAQHAKNIDFEFINIFSGAIATLPSKNLADKTLLEQKLHEVASKLFELQGSPLKLLPGIDQKRPLADTPQPIEHLIGQYDAGPIKNGLMRIQEQFTHYVPIAGDGHCLFRAIAHEFLSFFTQAAPQQIGTCIQNLEATIQSFNYPTITTKYDRFLGALKQFGESGESVTEAMQREEFSNSLVAFLRILAATYTFKKRSETFNQILAEQQITAVQYFQKIAGMNHKEMGDQVELIALSKSLSCIYIEVLDVKMIGNGAALYNAHTSYGDSNAPCKITLLYRSGHYDIARKF